MMNDKLHIRHCILQQQINASEAIKSICSILGNDIRTCQCWFAKFRNSDFNLEDNECSGRSESSFKRKSGSINKGIL